ncbi:MAG: precorrin-6A/cobalt-precorrin-6A reductase [Tissierellia bacterium]|nr:precorrin-6A/cobalt-precorrin-6A reductase [Tissierellia bacterium]
MKLMVFAGSAEARRWINHGRRRDYEQWVFVNTDFGKDLLPEQGDNLRIFVGKKNKEEIKNLLPEDCLAIIDGCHPFCESFSNDLKALADEIGVEYFRLLQEEKTPDGIEVVNSYEEAVAYLEKTSGNILLTTGIDSLRYFVSSRLHLRIYARIEPNPEVVQRAVDLGLGFRQILALQGPFGLEMNEAMINQYKIKIMVTGESALQEAVEEKALAAKKAGITLVVVRNTDEKGYLLYELEKKIEKLALTF